MIPEEAEQVLIEHKLAEAESELAWLKQHQRKENIMWYAWGAAAGVVVVGMIYMLVML